MSILKNYEILSVIGEGTFGVVKLGKNKENGEDVAIKILEKTKIKSKEDEKRVEREIDIVKRINHINVIKIIKIEEDKENIYFIMEYCSKGELFNLIVKKQRLGEIEAAYYFYQLINGLESIHHNGIAHRDLKPENLLLCKGNILKIIDFGLSNYFNGTQLLSTPCGSPCYASPEMVSGKQYDGFIIDIWSTGIILYAMLCGYLPFEDPDNEILFQKILFCEVEFPNYLSSDSINLLKKIMVANAKERITLSGIKKHPFYLKKKKQFKSLHPNLVEKVEIDYSKNTENNNKHIERNENKNNEMVDKNKKKYSNHFEIEENALKKDNNKIEEKKISKESFNRKKIIEKI